MSFSLPKKERLYLRKEIEHLFSKGKSIKQFPLKLLYTDNPTEPIIPLKILVSVPKRNFKKAIQRNRIKRLIKENYRLQKNNFKIHNSPPRAIGIIYMGKSLPSFSLIEEKMVLLLSEYEKIINQ